MPLHPSLTRPSPGPPLRPKLAGDARRVAVLACSVGLQWGEGTEAAHVRAVSVRLEKHRAAKKMEMVIGNARVHPGLRTVGARGVGGLGRWAMLEGSGTAGAGDRRLASGRAGGGGDPT